MKVNYINQLNGFLDLLYIKPLSTSAICLYVILFHLNNKCGWLKEFTVANLTIQGLAGMSRNQLHKARLELIQKGYIDYKKGSGNQCGTYLLVRFDTQTDTQINTQTNTQMDTQIDTQKQHSSGTLNKLNKTKPNNLKESVKENHSVFRKPTLNEIKDYCVERKNNVDAENFFDFYESKGWFVGKNPMKDWKASVRTWEKSNKKIKDKPTNAYVDEQSEQYKDLDKFYI